MDKNTSSPKPIKGIGAVWEPESVSEDQRIWRYMDIDKFQYNTLYMSPMSKFLDTYEGTFTQKTIEMFHQHMSSSSVSTLKTQNQKHIDEIFVSCWHINDRENMIMWKTYTSSRSSVVIESTVKQLRDALNNSLQALARPANNILEESGFSPNTHIVDSYVIKIGKVNYIDETHVMASYNAYETIFSKRKKYEFENELRAVIHRKISSNILAKGVNTVDKLPNWDINVSNLLSSVRIHPEGDTIFENEIRSLFKFIPVRRSTIL